MIKPEIKHIVPYVFQGGRKKDVNVCAEFKKEIRLLKAVKSFEVESKFSLFDEYWKIVDLSYESLDKANAIFERHGVNELLFFLSPLKFRSKLPS